METETVGSGSRRVVLAGVCEGLSGEAQAVARLVQEVAPGTVALALEAELAEDSQGWATAEQLGSEDEAYAKGLARYGEVQLPPPEFGAAAGAAEQMGTRVIGVDMDEDRYTVLFTDQVSFWDLFKRSRWISKLEKRPPQAGTPEAFCRAFDERANRGSFRGLEEVRERTMADGVMAALDDGPVLLVLPVARLEGVRAHLARRMG